MDRRTRASSVDGQLSSKKSLSESLYKSQNSFDKTNNNNNRTHYDKKNVVSEIDESSSDRRRGGSKGKQYDYPSLRSKHNIASHSNSLFQSSIDPHNRKRNAPTNSDDFNDVIVKVTRQISAIFQK